MTTERTDTDRLDWLSKNGWWLDNHRPIRIRADKNGRLHRERRPKRWELFLDPELWPACDDVFTGPSLRDVINKAMDACGKARNVSRKTLVPRRRR